MHREQHRTQHVGWLRAAVLGANDGLISTSSLIVGIASAQSTRDPILLAGLAGLVAGALSMAAGEFVSVASQADIEHADLERETRELKANPESELAELTRIYVERGLTPDLARQVAEQLSAGDVLAAHARDELGLVESTRARPLQAAFTSAGAFAAGAVVPLLLAAMSPLRVLTPLVMGTSLVILFALGGLAARLGGASPARGALRVGFWGLVAMAATAIVGRIFGTAV